MPEKVPVLFDTDIGSDIDDAVCLSYLLRQPRCELLGVTTVAGDVAKRAALAAEVCRAAGRTDVPIHMGSPGPLLIGVEKIQVPQYEAIAARPHRKDFLPHTALEFMRQTIRQRPGEVTLLAVGPMTNVALLFAADPEIPSLLRQLVLMCGVFTARNGHGPGTIEWNARCDPIATAITYRARPPRFTSIGLEVTTRCCLPADECRRRFAAAGGPLGVVAEMAEIWFRRKPQITFHDPLAGAVIFEPDLCGYEEGRVEVETASPRLAGLTHWNPDAEEKPHRVAVEVDPDRFFDHYFAIVGG